MNLKLVWDTIKWPKDDPWHFTLFPIIKKYPTELHERQPGLPGSAPRLKDNLEKETIRSMIFYVEVDLQPVKLADHWRTMWKIKAQIPRWCWPPSSYDSGPREADRNVFQMLVNKLPFESGRWLYIPSDDR